VLQLECLQRCFARTDCGDLDVFVAPISSTIAWRCDSSSSTTKQAFEAAVDEAADLDEGLLEPSFEMGFSRKRDRRRP